jgi:hypothetical protein
MSTPQNPNVEIIPSGNVTEGIEKVIGDTTNLTAQVVPLIDKAKALKVTWPDKTSYESAGALLTEGRNLKKQGEALWAPFNLKVERVRNFLKQKLQAHTNRVNELEGYLLQPMRDWEIAEKNAARKEEEKLNKEREKRGASPVSVEANVPATAGYRRSTVWGAYVEDFDKLLRAWVTATGKEKIYLRQFICANEKQLSIEARNVKKPAELMKRIPGVRFSEE